MIDEDRCQQLEAEIRLLKKQNRDLGDKITSLQNDLKEANMRASILGGRIVDAGRLLKDKKDECDNINKEYKQFKKEHRAMIREKEEEIEQLKDQNEDLSMTIEMKDREIKDLNEKYELSLKNSLEETTLCSKLQDQNAEMEKLLKEFQSKPEKTNNTINPINSAPLYDLLRDAQQKSERVRSEYIELERKYSIICKEKYSLKEDYDEMAAQYEEMLRRESHFQALNRQLRSKLVTAESRLVEFNQSKEDAQPSSLNSSTGSADTVVQVETPMTENQHKMSLLVKENNNLVELLSLLSGMNTIPFMGVGNILQWLENERSRLIACVRDERSLRRSLEEQLIFTKRDYEQLQIIYERLNNPVEGLECCYAMRQETDIRVVQDALEEKCSHLTTIRDQVKKLEEEKKQIAQSLQQLYSMNIAFEEKMKAIQDENQYKELIVNELKVEKESLDSQLLLERSQNEERADELWRLQKVGVNICDDLKSMDEVEDVKKQLETKDKIISDLKTQLSLTNFLGTDTGASIFQTSKNEAEINRLKESLEKRKKEEERLNHCISDLGEKIITFLYTLCDVCTEYDINHDLTDTINRRITHINKTSENKHYVDDLLSIITTSSELVETSVNDYFRVYDDKYRSFVEDNKSVQNEIRQAYQQQIDLYKKRLQQYDENNDGMGTTRSLGNPNLSIDETMRNYSYLQRQYENLESANALYLKQINELTICLQTAFNRSPVPSMTIISNDYDSNMVRYQLDQEKASKTLWKARAEQLEILLSQSINNQSCLTDYELSILSAVVDNLYEYVIQAMQVDYDLGVPIQFCENEYNMQVNNQENREPLIMETRLYVIRRIIDTFIPYVNGRIYALQSECEDERERRYYLEKELRIH